MTAPVLVTGASGFLASHLILQLLKRGDKVRGTVRNLNALKKVDPLKTICPEAAENLELIEADLLQADSWPRALDGGVQYVYHVASPFPLSPPRNPDDVIRPAVDGTLNVLRACESSGSVRRVVLTGSTISIISHTAAANQRKLNEEDWADVDTATPYGKSKILAERAAWDFVKQLPEEKRFELAVVNPGYILGPLLFHCSCTSVELPKRILERAMPAVPRVNTAIVDVRDVAASHIKAMTTEEASGHRHILLGSHMWFSEVASILNREFGPLGYNVPTRELPNVLVKLASWFDKSLKTVVPMLGDKIELDNRRMIEVLQVEVTPSYCTIVDMSYSLIDLGIVKRTSKYRPREKSSS